MANSAKKRKLLARRAVALLSVIKGVCEDKLNGMQFSDGKKALVACFPLGRTRMVIRMMEGDGSYVDMAVEVQPPRLRKEMDSEEELMAKFSMSNAAKATCTNPECAAHGTNAKSLFDAIAEQMKNAGTAPRTEEDNEDEDEDKPNHQH